MSIIDFYNDSKKIPAGKKISIEIAVIEKGTIITSSDNDFKPRTGEFLAKVAQTTDVSDTPYTPSGCLITNFTSTITEVPSVNKDNLISTKGKTFTKIDPKMLKTGQWVTVMMRGEGNDDYLVSGVVENIQLRDRSYSPVKELSLSGIDVLNWDIDEDKILELWEIN